MDHRTGFAVFIGIVPVQREICVSVAGKENQLRIIYQQLLELLCRFVFLIEMRLVIRVAHIVAGSEAFNRRMLADIDIYALIVVLLDDIGDPAHLRA